MMSNRSMLLTAAAICCLAGRAVAQNAFTYNGGAAGVGANGRWSLAANWAAPAGAPAAGGGAAFAITINRAANGQNPALLDLGVAPPAPPGLPRVFDLNKLIFAAGSKDTTLGGAGGRDTLVFRDAANAAPRITHSTNGGWHEIDAPVHLGNGIGGRGVTFIDGAATVAGGFSPRLIFLGAIGTARGANPQALNIGVSEDTSVEFAGANTYTDGTTVNSGTVVVRNNAAFGTGRLTLDAAVANQIEKKVRLVARNEGGGPLVNGANQFAIANDVTINKTMIFGGDPNAAANGTPARLKLNGKATIANSLTTRLEGGADHRVELAGPIELAAANTWTIVGDTAPVKPKGRELQFNSVITYSGRPAGNQPAQLAPFSNFRGNVALNSATFNLTQGSQLGLPNNRMGTLTVGDGTTTAALTGKGSIFVNKATDVSAASDVRIVDKGLVKPGNSPGVLTINGGRVAMEGGSRLAIEYGGHIAGQDDFNNAQLLLEDSTMVLTQNTSTGQRPVLEVEPWAGYVPVVGSELTIIRQSAVEDAPFPAISTLFQDSTGLTLSNLSVFTDLGITYQIVYNHTPGSWSNPLTGDLFQSSADELLNDGNDVVLRVLAIPTPGAAALLGLGALAAARRRR